MRVFLAGATGAIGRPLVPKLVAAGHEVTALTRDADKTAALREAGAIPVVGDVFDEVGLEQAMHGSRPEVVIHQLTALPRAIAYGRFKDPYPATSRLRTEGTRNLIAAAHAAGAKRMVAQSIAFLYAPEGGPVKSEEDPPMSSAPKPFGAALEATLDLEHQVLNAPGLDGLVLRYGSFYGPGTYYSLDGSMAADARKRRLPILGDGSGQLSFVHIDDAASATLAAVERGAPGIYNVVDDEPAAGSEWTPAWCEAVGAPAPRRVPIWLAKLFGGGFISVIADLRGASNEKARRELDWTPRFPSWRQGFKEGLGS